MTEICREKPTTDTLARLYRDAGWLEDPETLDLKKSIENTSVWILAKEAKVVVGIARLQTDYVRYCCVYDLIIRSDRRREGIGRKIMNEALAFCEENRVQVMHLWPTKGNAGYYTQFGFQALGPDQPTMMKATPQPT